MTKQEFEILFTEAENLWILRRNTLIGAIQLIFESHLFFNKHIIGLYNEPVYTYYLSEQLYFIEKLFSICDSETIEIWQKSKMKAWLIEWSDRQ